MRQLARHHLEQRGHVRAIHAYNPYFLPAMNRENQPVEYHVVPIAFTHVRQFNDILPASLARRKMKTHGLARLIGFDRFHFVERSDSALHGGIADELDRTVSVFSVVSNHAPARGAPYNLKYPI
jgi:hypothetical protein